VQVFDFPKREKRASRDPWAIEPSATQTIPDFRPDFEPDLVTEPDYRDRPSSPSLALDPPGPTRRANSDERRKSSRRASGLSRRKSSSANAQRGGSAASAREPTSRAPRSTAEQALFGHRLFEKGRLAEARQVFERLVGRNIRDAFPHAMLGTIYLALGDQDRALALFEAALQLDPNEISSLVYRGEIRLNRGRLKQAMADLQRAVTLGLADNPFVQRAHRLIRVGQDLLRRQRR
jgi:tetratricopeptide (TPR) repeat protein